MSQPVTKTILILALLMGLSLVAVSGCGGSDGGGGSATVPTVESNGSEEEPVVPDYGSDESAESEYGSEESAEPGYGSEESTVPDQQPSTDPCAFPGDPLCPDTPVKVPPPDISNWP